MPITITPPAPTAFVGPGAVFSLQSDFIGPLPTGAFWTLTVSLDPEGTQRVIQQVLQSNSNPSSIMVGQGRTTGHPQSRFLPQAGTNVRVIAELLQPPAVVIDSGVTDLPWQTTQASWQLQVEANDKLAGAATSGGFTGEDRQLLIDTERRSQVIGEPVDLLIQTASGLIPSTLARLFGRSWLNNLVLEERTAGETCDPVQFAYNEWYAGVAIRVTTIAEDLTPKTPDQEWYLPDLAVLRLFRGDLLRYRRGIHTPTFVTDEPYEWGWNIRNFQEWLGGPPATTVRVDWRPGCCGRVYLVRIP